MTKIEKYKKEITINYNWYKRLRELVSKLEGGRDIKSLSQISHLQGYVYYLGDLFEKK